MSEAANCIASHRRDPDRPRRALDGGHLCAGHIGGLRRDLATLPTLHRLLATSLGGANAPDDGRTGLSTGIALDQEIVRTRDHIRATLVSWAQITLEEGPWTVAPRDALTDIAIWLDARIPWLAARPWADQLVKNLSETTAEARALIQPDRPYRVELGPCPELLDDDTRCDGTVIAVMRRQDSLLPSVVRCTSHGDDDENPHAWGAAQWHALGRHMGLTLNDTGMATLIAALDTPHSA